MGAVIAKDAAAPPDVRVANFSPKVFRIIDEALLSKYVKVYSYLLLTVLRTFSTKQAYLTTPMKQGQR